MRAVDGVSLRLGERETLGWFGESGCGKTTLGRAILGLAPVTEVSIHFQDKTSQGAMATLCINCRKIR